jgi:hypothetical protein
MVNIVTVQSKFLFFLIFDNWDSTSVVIPACFKPGSTLFNKFPPFLRKRILLLENGSGLKAWDDKG